MRPPVFAGPMLRQRREPSSGDRWPTAGCARRRRRKKTGKDKREATARDTASRRVYRRDAPTIDYRLPTTTVKVTSSRDAAVIVAGGRLGLAGLRRAVLAERAGRVEGHARPCVFSAAFLVAVRGLLRALLHAFTGRLRGILGRLAGFLTGLLGFLARLLRVLFGVSPSSAAPASSLSGFRTPAHQRSPNS